MQNMPSPDQLNAIRAQFLERAWNALVPACAIAASLEPNYVRYLHPTKGWRYVGKRRFAIRGVR
jgi:hypothetical protein